MTSRSFLVRVAPLLLTGLLGCSGPDGVPLGTVRMRLIDAPAAIQAVHIEVTEVSVHPADGLSGQAARDGLPAGADTGWEIVTDQTVTYDLLTLRGGTFATLAEALVPVGNYTQIRLKIGKDSNVVVDGVTHPLVVPSGAQSGLKLIHDFTVTPNAAANLTLDFDAAKSVSQTGDGTWHLKPTITVTSTSDQLGTARP